MRVRPLDSHYPEEICTTDNVSKGGFYFTTGKDHYVKGMALQITRNFQPGDPTNKEESADVIRVEQVGEGKWGVAVRILLHSNAVPEFEF